MERADSSTLTRHSSGTGPRLLVAVCAFAAISAACSLAGIVAAPAENEALPEQAFEFLLGDWTLDTWFVQEDGTRVSGTAQLTARRSLGGAGIERRAEHPRKDGGPSFHSMATYVFNKRMGKWIGAGINSLGNAKQYEAEVRDGKVIVKQSGMLFEGRPGLNRVTYFDIRDSGFKLLFEHSSDEGSTWVTEYGATATRAGGS